MRTAKAVGVVALAAALVCGCATLGTEKLRVGMTEQEVNALYGQPKAIYTQKQGGDFVQVIDYSKESLGIPNYLDDYGWIKYPTTRVVRAWFVDGRLTSWCGGSYKSYEALRELEMKCELRVPPSFAPAAVPDAVRRAKSQGK